MSEARGSGQTDAKHPVSPTSAGVNSDVSHRAAMGIAAPPASPCVTNLVFDEPESDDEFGPHQRIADALAALISGGEKSIAVGVEGAWGSGKTTVVNLLRKAVGDRGDYALITFDAWAHEGDPLRRTFLETVVEQLKEKQQAGGAWIDAAEWEKRLDVISQRRKVEENKNVPKLSRWDKALIFSLAFVPLGNAILGAALREEFTIRWLAPPAWKFLFEFVFGLLFILAPLTVLLTRFLKSEAGQDDLNIWTLLSSKGVSEVRTETTKTPEPTSLEFEKAFRELTQEALVDPNRKIILVIDNLDRVDSEDALTIWSTLQTFLQHRPNPRYDWLNRLWTLVLYDPRGLSALWAAPAGGGKAAAANVYKSFVDKTFQVRFEVPAPVLSEWRDYLIKKVRDAFPSHPEDWHTVYRVRALHATARRPTARELKLFVNQIGALHRQWSRGGTRQLDEYPLPHIASYVLLREEYPELLPSLLSGLVPTQNDKNLLGPDLSRSIAGLVFNVERELGYQMLLEGPIKLALIEGKGEEIKEWAEKTDGFWEVLEGVVSSNWFGDEPLLLANAAQVLEESGVLAAAERYERQTVAATLCDSASRVSEWPFDQSGRVYGLATFCRWKAGLSSPAETEVFAKGIFKGMARWLLQDAHRPTFNISQWVNVTRLIARELTTDGVPSAPAEAVVDIIDDLYKSGSNPRPIQVTYGLEVLWEFASQDDPAPAAVGQLYTLAAFPAFMDYLKKSSDMSDFTRALCLLTILYYRQGGRWDFLATADHLEETLGEASGKLVSKFTDLLDRYKRLPFLLEIGDNLPSADKFVMGCLRYIAGTKIEYAERLFTPETFIDWYPRIWYKLDIEETKYALTPQLTARMIDQTELVNRILESTFDPNTAPLYETVYLASKDERLKAWCYRGLKSVDRVQWQKEMRGEGDLTDLINRLGAPHMDDALGEEYRLALLQAGLEILEGKLDPKFPSIWPQLLEALPPADRKQLRQALLINLETMKQSIPAKFFEIFGEEIADPALLNNQPHIFSSLFTPLVKSKNLGAIRWIADILPRMNIGKLTPSKLDGLNALREEIRSLSDKNLSSEDHKAVKALNDALRLDITGGLSHPVEE